MTAFYSKLFMKQKMMRTVLLATLPIIFMGVYSYGWRALVLTLFNILIAVVVEYLCETKMYKRKKVSEAVIVSAVLYTLTLPPALPFWISGIGIAFGVFFGKAVYGGFARNIFNPALVGRTFIYINFPQPLTINWNVIANSENFVSGIGGLNKWITPLIDGTTGATPMMAFRESGTIVDHLELFLGQVPGSIGEAYKFLIVLAAIYLLVKKVASWEVIAAQLVGFVGMSLVFNVMGQANVPDPLTGLLMGGFLFGAVFMATDPISAPKTSPAKWVYGILIGVCVVVIRGFALFSGGMMFAILLGNVFTPIMDYMVNRAKQKKKEVAVE